MTCIIKLNKAFFILLLLIQKEQISPRCQASLSLKYSTYLGRDANIDLDTLVPVYSSRSLCNASYKLGMLPNGEGREGGNSHKRR